MQCRYKSRCLPRFLLREREREMGNPEERRRRLVMVPLPFQGHINPMLQLGTILHSKGFSITIVHTQFNSPNPSNHPDFTFSPISDGLSDGDISSGNVIAIVSALNINCIAPLRQLLDQMMRQQAQDKHEHIACIIYDGSMYFCESLAVELELPSLRLETSSAVTLLARSAFPKLSAEGLIPLQDSMLQDLVPGLQPLRFKDLPISNFGKIEDFLQLLAQICNRRTFSAFILNTIDSLEHPILTQLQQQYQVPFFSIGPLHNFALAPSTSLITEDTSCIKWLDKQTHKSVLYVSLGSVASINEKQLLEMAWGLVNSNQPFLWVIRPGSIRDSEWIELLPEEFLENVGERGCIVKWAPQRDVLAHKSVGGFWSHCGWNSTLESIYEGVPMICQPCFGDQKVNARYLSHVWKVGLQLENELERGEVERAVKRLMVDQDGEEMRRNAMALKENVEFCINDGGSSQKSLNDLVNYILSF